MKIRQKMFLVILPLVIGTLALAQAASYFNAVNGVTRLARQLLGFKLGELERYAESQWTLLVENDFAGRPDMVAAAKTAVEMFGRSIALSDTERVFAVDNAGNIDMASAPLTIRIHEREALLELLRYEIPGLQNAVIDGEMRVLQAFYFAPFQRFLVISEKHDVFYYDANRITMQAVITIIVSVIVISILLILITAHLTNPLSRVVKTMNNIIKSADLSSRVEVEYQDETGVLAHTFNKMIGELDIAYNHIKRYAFDAVLAGKKEERIRHIFQKYVPNDVIERFFASPEKMLVGDNRKLSILFSDIRGFTTISEGMAPDNLVNSLNRYFSGQVDIIYNRKGIVDKYIGDAIMAFWGAPEKHEDDVLQSVLAGLDMIDSVAAFNAGQRAAGKPEFYIGIGINYGEVTVGNIGSERKMDYTVIGDSVNLASRMEGLTKTYHSEILVTESVYAELQQTGLLKAASLVTGGASASSGAAGLSFRLLDTVAVKGKTRGVKVYTVKRSLSQEEAAAWPVHNQGMELYYRCSFKNAAEKFKEASRLLGGDLNAENLYNRCMDYAVNPPPSGWDGVEVMKTK